MRTRRWTVMVTGVALVFAGQAFGQEKAEQRVVDMKTMSVGDLDKAGDACRARKDYEGAIQYFQEAVRRDKKSAKLRNKLGLAELQAGQTEQARYDFEKAAKLNPKFADAHNNVGAVYFMQNKLGPAAKYFKKAVALEETRAAFHVNLGAAWFGQKKFERAIGEYARALELDPLVLEQHAKVGVTAQIASPQDQAKYYYMLAKLHAKRGDVDNCLVCLKKAKENGYRDLANVYKEEEFSKVWSDARLGQVVPPPVTQ